MERFMIGVSAAFLLLVAFAIYNLSLEHPINLFAWTVPKPDTSASGALSDRVDLVTPGSGDDGFGLALKLSADALVVGAAGDERGGKAAGSALVYRRKATHWVLETRLAPKNLSPGDHFGESVAIDGDRIVVSAPDEDGSTTQVDGPIDERMEGSGAAYVFERHDAKWQETAYLKTSDVRNADGFGSVVALDGEVVAIGAPRASAPGLMNPDQIPHIDPRSRQPATHSDHASWAGVVYVFRKGAQGWLEETRLVPDEHQSGLEFGAEVAADGDTIAVGCGRSEFFRGGHVYVFRYVGGAWKQEAHLSSPAGSAADADRFGQGISLHGDRLAVGSPREGGSKLYVYERKNAAWRLRDSIDAAKLELGDVVGSRLVLAGDTLLASSASEGKVQLLDRASRSWKLRGSAGSTESYWARLDYDATSHTLATQTTHGVSLLTVH